MPRTDEPGRNEGERGKGFWNRIRLAQADTAEASPSDPAAQADDDAELKQLMIEEVIVTAQRRVERLQDVPVSVQVINGQTLAAQNHDSLASLTQTIPGVHIVPAGGASFMVVRGISSLGNQSFDQSVALFSDDVYHGRSRTSVGAFLDLERVEFMKGPQTTYFGANAIAGALNLISQKPGNEFDAWARALYGEHGRYVLEGAVGGPLSDTFGIRVAATFNGTDGWIENINSGQHVPELENRAGRVTLAFRPDVAFDAVLKFERGKHDEVGAVYIGPQQIVNCPPPAPIPPTFAGGICSQALALGVPRGLDGDKSSETPGSGNWLDTTESVLTANYRLGEHTLTSVSGYYEYDFNLQLDGDGLPANVGNYTSAPEHGDQFSQELRISSPTGQRFEYLAGVYYQSDDTDFDLENNFYNVNGAISNNPALAALVPYIPLARNFGVSQSGRTYSAFGALTWNATDRLKLNTGLRASRVEKTTSQTLLYGSGTQTFGGFVPLPAALQSPTGYFGLGIPSTFNAEREDSAWMPSAKIRYKLNPRAMVYVSYDRGFKAGGFNGTDNTGNPANIPYEPEYVNAYEVGLKSELFDNTFLLNLAVFRSEYSDLQVSVTNFNAANGTSISLVTNAASALTEGVELETQWVIDQNFRLSANVTYNDARYVDYRNSAPNVSQQFLGLRTQDLSGQPMVLAPKWSGSLTASYNLLLPGEYKFITELSPYFTSDYSLHPLTDRQFLWQDGYTRLDARLGLQSPDGRWAVDLIGKNLTNRTYKIGYAGAYLASKTEPRNLAAQFRYQW